MGEHRVTDKYGPHCSEALQASGNTHPLGHFSGRGFTVRLCRGGGEPGRASSDREQPPHAGRSCWRPGPSHQPGCDSASLTSSAASWLLLAVVSSCNPRPLPTSGPLLLTHPGERELAARATVQHQGPHRAEFQGWATPPPGPSAYPTGRCQANPWPGQLRPGCGLPCPAVPVVPPGAVGEARPGREQCRLLQNVSYFYRGRTTREQSSGQQTAPACHVSCATRWGQPQATLCNLGRLWCPQSPCSAGFTGGDTLFSMTLASRLWHLCVCSPTP